MSDYFDNDKFNDTCITHLFKKKNVSIYLRYFLNAEFRQNIILAVTFASGLFKF